MYNGVTITTALIRMGLSFTGLFMLLPAVLFRKEPGARALDSFYAGLVKMVFLIQVTAYALAAVRLYEVISLVTVFLVTALWRIRSSMTPEQASLVRSMITAQGLDLADRKVGLSHLAARCRATAAGHIRGLRDAMRDRLNIFDSLTLFAVLGYAVYLRFLDPIVSAAPAMSDSYVTLAWMKYIERRQLFHDGIYPHGFHIWLSVIHKFSAIDSLFVLKYAGPFNSVLTTLSCYYFVSRMTKNPLAGVCSAFAYGCMPSFMPYEFQRQAATNSQEFAMLFLLPAVVFIVRYLRQGSPSDLAAGFCAVAVMGLTHPVVTLFAVVGAFAAVCASVFSLSTGFRRLLRLAGAGIGAGCVACAPLAAGLLAGIPFHGSSAEFAVAEGVPWMPVVQPLHAAVLIAGVAGCVLSAAAARSRQARAGFLCCGFLVLGSVLVYMAPMFDVQNLALAARSGEIYALGLCVALGGAISAVVPQGSAARHWFVVAWGWLTRAGVAGLAMAVLVLYPQSPARPYKMQTNESAEQYIRILLTDTPTDWLIVSDFEGYSLVLGRGWHLMTRDFVRQVDPSGERLEMAQNGVSSPLEMSRIYLFYEENPYKPPIDEAIPEYERKVVDQGHLAEWIREYEAHHGPLEVYHRGPDLTIYVIERPRDKREEFERIWGQR